MFQINVPMILYNAFLVAPPGGNLGVFERDTCEYQPGDRLEFQILDETRMEGIVTLIEGPESNIRKDIQPSSKYKIHWVPVPNSRLIYQTISPTQCPNVKCLQFHKKVKRGTRFRSKVFNTIHATGSILRYRLCLNCGCRWITNEYFTKVVKNIVRKRK